MPSKDPARRFRAAHVVSGSWDSIARIERFTTGMDFAAFSSSEQVAYAVNHALLILSEAAAKLGEQAEQPCPEIVWADIRGLGNRLASGRSQRKTWRPSSPPSRRLRGACANKNPRVPASEA